MCRHIHVYDWNIVACDVKLQIHLTSSILDNIMLFFFFEKKRNDTDIQRHFQCEFLSFSQKPFCTDRPRRGGGCWKSTPPLFGTHAMDMKILLIYMSGIPLSRDQPCYGLSERVVQFVWTWSSALQRRSTRNFAGSKLVIGCIEDLRRLFQPYCYLEAGDDQSLKS